MQVLIGSKKIYVTRQYPFSSWCSDFLPFPLVLYPAEWSDDVHFSTPIHHVLTTATQIFGPLHCAVHPWTTICTRRCLFAPMESDVQIYFWQNLLGVRYLSRVQNEDTVPLVFLLFISGDKLEHFSCHKKKQLLKGLAVVYFCPIR